MKTLNKTKDLWINLSQNWCFPQSSWLVGICTTLMFLCKSFCSTLNWDVGLQKCTKNLQGPQCQHNNFWGHHHAWTLPTDKGPAFSPRASLRYLTPELPLSGAPGFPMAHLALLSCNSLPCPICSALFLDAISQNHSGFIWVRLVTKQFNSQFYNNTTHHS